MLTLGEATCSRTSAPSYLATCPVSHCNPKKKKLLIFDRHVVCNLVKIEHIDGSHLAGRAAGTRGAVKSRHLRVAIK